MPTKETLTKACRDAGLECHSTCGTSSFYSRDEPPEWAEIHIGAGGQAYCTTPNSSHEDSDRYGSLELNTPDEIRSYFSTD